MLSSRVFVVSALSVLLMLESGSSAAETPFSGSPIPIPGTVEAENFNKGGEGIAYHDTTKLNQGGAYRLSEGVDIQAGGSRGSGQEYQVGYIESGEWLEYTVNVTSPGTFQIDTVVASNSKGGTFHISIDGTNKTGTLNLPNTGGWADWKVVTKTGVSLAGGTHIMRLTFDSSNSAGADIGNVDFIRFTKTVSGTSDDGFHPNKLTWKQVATNPMKREEAQSLVFNGKLYELGGFDDDFNASKRVDVYDPVANKWSPKKSMPYPITHAAVARDPDGHTFWFVGGFLGSFTHNPPVGPPGTDIVYKYDASTDSWSKGPSLPVAHGAGGAGLVNNQLYFFGGSNKMRTADLNDVYKLDLAHESNGWTRIGSMPNARNHLGGICVAGKIYAIGGQHHLVEDSVTQNEVDRYDPTTNTWTRIASLPEPLSHFNASTVLYDRYIITAGGENPHNTARPDVFAYDTVLGQWARLSDLPDPAPRGHRWRDR